MKYADLELAVRGEFPHGLRPPGFIERLDKNTPWYFQSTRHMHLWPALGDNWSDLKEPEKAHDISVFYTLAWWKMGEGIVDDWDE